MQFRRRTFNGMSNRLTKRVNGSSKKVPHYARIQSNPTGGSKRRSIALKRSRRYSSSGGAGPAGAGGLNAEIAAINAVFNGAVGGANLTKVQVKDALKAYKSANSALSEKAKDHLFTLMTSLSHHRDHTLITPALLAADTATLQSAATAANQKDIASRSCGRPNPLSVPLQHSRTDPKSKPASPR
jgi:hypothetical protein